MSSPLTKDNIQLASRLSCYQLDPTKDARWAELVKRHPRASIFHTVPWLEAIKRTYGYEPVVFTTSPPTGDVKNGLIFCRIDSWLTGNRLVSLPFSDHCAPLCDSPEDLNFLIRYLQTALEHQKWKYLEIRPVDGTFGEPDSGIGFRPTATYFLHTVDLRPDLDNVFRSLHKDSVQRRIQRAERAGLVEKCGRSDDLLKDFYGLFVATRVRHNVPPIPFAWFRNLTRSQEMELEIRLAYKDRIPIAAILTLRFRDVVYYKYGGSDPRFNKYGAIPWLLWRALATGKSNGATEMDLGRTEEDNAGLLAFKNHWAPRSKSLVYWNFPGTPTLDSAHGWKLKMAKRVFSYMPDILLSVTGRLLYRHIG
ncbi:MAG: GNAT family N-acetyltransferase [Candidatus Acidiferrales bacterium]